MGGFEVPEGWTVQAYRFALDPARGQERAFWSHAGGARKAHNIMLGLVKATMGQRAAERTYGIAETDLTPALDWSLAGLRKEWNRRKDAVAPWWAENSKEAYNSGLDGLARGLQAWSKSRNGERAGRAVGFPAFKSRRGRASVRFTTGALSCDGAGRWHVAFQTLIRRAAETPHHAGRGEPVVGVDAGVKAEGLLVIATPDGREIERVAAPKSLTAAQRRLRLLQRKAARQHGPYDPATRTKQQPSARWRTTQRRIGRTHAHAAAVRTDALHKATTKLAQRHQVITVETLNASGMARQGRRLQKGPEPGTG